MDNIEIRAHAIEIAFRTFDTYTQILMSPETSKNVSSIKIPTNPFVLSDAIVEYIKTGHEPDIELTEMIKIR